MRHFNRLGEPVPKNIVVVRALRGLGDMLCIAPALRALRAGLPEARITLLGLPWAQSFVSRFHHYLDDYLEFPGYPCIPECPARPEALPAFLAEVHDRHFDLALQMHGSGTVTNPFTALLGARVTAGCYLPALICPDPEHFMPYPAHAPEVRRWLKLMDFLGLPPAGEALEFPLTDGDHLELTALEETGRLKTGRYVCLHPGAHDARRRWPAERFAVLGDALAARGLQVVVTGSEGERDVTRAVVNAMQTRPLDLTGRTSLGALAALLAEARLLICNDTGVSHLADALGCPSVVVFIASDPERWAPLDRRRHRVVGHPTGQNGCLHCETCTRGHRCLRDGCMSARPPTQLSERAQPGVGEVLTQADELLNEEQTYAFSS